NTYANFHFILWEIESRLADVRYDTRSESHPHAATVGVHLVAKGGNFFKGSACLGGRAADFFSKHGCANATASGRVKAILHGNIVVDHHGFDLDRLRARKVGGHLEVHHVAGVVLDDVQHPIAAVHCFCRFKHLVGRRTCENRTRAGGIKHATADEAAMHWFMAASAARNQGDLALYGRIGASDEVGIGVNFDDIAESGTEAGNGFENYV